MKEKFLLGLISILFLSVLSCESADQPDGKWDDNIKLSTKEVNFTAEPNSVVINTEGTFWWISEIGLNNDWDYDLSGIDTTQDSFLIEEPEFTIERRNAREIYISMVENQSVDERTLTIGLQAGNYFDGIQIIQAGR